MAPTHDFPTLSIVDHPLVRHKLTLLRDRATPTKQFKELVDEIAMLMAYEATRDLVLEPVGVESPLEHTTGWAVRGKKLTLVPILRAMVEENRYPRLGEIDLPVAIMVGTDDRTTPGFHTDELHAGIPGSTLERIPDVGHMVVWEDPDVVVAALRRLVGRD